ncbi:MAG: cytochrome c oxidase assembly factor Coa1 family protein [Chthoniobacterales bacterium]
MPTGCLTLLALIVVFVAAIVLIVFGALKSTDVYKHALRTAQSNPAVIAALGTPLQEGMFLSGSTHTNAATGDADLAIPISGPKGKGTIYVTAAKSAGEWTYLTLVVKISDNGERINLLGQDEPEQSPSDQP